MSDDENPIFNKFFRRGEHPKNEPSGGSGGSGCGHGGMDSVDEAESEFQRVLNVALGELPYRCYTCGEFCTEHGHQTKLRDAFFNRAAVLSQQLIHAIAIYKGAREALELEHPGQIIEKVYDRWTELAALFNHTEPQDWEDEEAGPLSDEDFAPEE